MARMVPLPVKIKEELLHELQDRAATLEMPSFSEYIRLLLTKNAEQENQMSAMIRMIEEIDFDKNKSILIEILLLMRLMSTTTNNSVVKNEMAKLGIEPWSKNNG